MKYVLQLALYKLKLSRMENTREKNNLIALIILSVFYLPHK
jgi:hypothetical protein